MKNKKLSETLFIEELREISKRLHEATKNLPFGLLIKKIRLQMGMTQSELAKRAGVPQPTISRIEKGTSDTTISTLKKILAALSCDLVMAPFLHDSIDSLRKEQAHKVAKERVEYVMGTMNLEEQEPDPRYFGMLLKEEEDHLLREPRSKMWREK